MARETAADGSSRIAEAAHGCGGVAHLADLIACRDVENTTEGRHAKRKLLEILLSCWRRGGESNPRVKVLQTCTSRLKVASFAIVAEIDQRFEPSFIQRRFTAPPPSHGAPR